MGEKHIFKCMFDFLLHKSSFFSDDNVLVYEKKKLTILR